MNPLTGTRRGDGLLAAGVLLLAVAVAFSPCLDAGFSSWDDDVYVTANPLVRSLAPANLAAIFSTFVSGNYHPLTILTHALEFALFGMQPRPAHAVNLLLHCALALLVLLLFRRLGLGPWPALAAALLYALHPARVEAVAWIADRKDLLGALFFLGALHAWLSRIATGSATAYLLALAAFLAALLAKGTGVALPLVLLLLDHLRGRRIDRRAVAEKVPFLLAALGFGLLALRARASYEAVLQEAGGSLAYRVILGGWRLVAYHLARLVLPVPLATLNPFYLSRTEDLPPPHLLALAAGALLVLALLLWRARRSREVMFGSLFFLLTLAPGLAAVTVGHTADRFSYLPSVGIWYLAGLGLDRHLARPGAPRLRRRLACAAPLILAALFVVLSRRECGIWQNGVTLWSEASRLYPAVAPFRLNLGNALARESRSDEAVRAYTAALELDPRFLEVLSARGAALGALGRYDLAAADLEGVLARDPAHPGALNNLGVLESRRGRYREALADFDRALGARPRFVEALVNRGRTRALAGDPMSARDDFAAAIALDPWRPDAWRGLGSARALTGDAAGAAEAYERALSVGGEDPAIRDLIGRLGARPD